MKDKQLPQCIICDIDSTIALMNGRDPYDHASCNEDLVNEPIKGIVERVMHDEAYEMVFFITGRSNKYAKKTMQWLLEYGLMSPKTALCMRDNRDKREDTIIKRELYEKYVKGKYNVDFILEDRTRVVTMWRKLGLTCLQVLDGNY